MSNPAATRWIDARISDALAGAFDQLDKYEWDGYCTADDIYEALANGWGDGVAAGWREWCDER